MSKNPPPKILRDRIKALKEIPISKIRGFSAGNPVDRTDRDRELLDASLDINGYVKPILVREISRTEWELIDGHGRIERILEKYPRTKKVKALILDVSSVAEGRKIMLGLRHEAEWGMDALNAWMEDALQAGEIEYDEAAALSGLTADDLDALAGDLTELGDDDGQDPSGPRKVTIGAHERLLGARSRELSHDDWTLHLGDCLDGLRKLDDNSVDAIVTDPPAGISFMGKDWDGDKGGRKQWIAWLNARMVEAFRVLKPGGHILSWAIPRTSHWTACAIEDAEFEIRDVVMHLFGSGFPKSLDVSKAIDAHLGAEREVVGTVPAPGSVMRRMSTDDKPRDGWAGVDGWSGIKLGDPVTPAAAAALQGWGTALKPAAEHWILARKPLDGTYAENVLEHGTGALNIDGCRIGTELMKATRSDGNGVISENFSMGGGNTGRVDAGTRVGRWPANLALEHAFECTVTDGFYACAEDCPIRMLDEQSGITRSSDAPRNNSTNAFASTTGAFEGPRVDGGKVSSGHSDIGGASRFFYTAKAARSEKDAGLDHLEPRTAGEATDRKDGSAGLNNPRAGAGRTGGARNWHPTVKPVSLMRWLCRLITPPGGLVLDMFTGSGTTAVAALIEGFRFVGFEKEAEFHELASARIRAIVDGLPGAEMPIDVVDDDDDPELPEPSV